MDSVTCICYSPPTEFPSRVSEREAMVLRWFSVRCLCLFSFCLGTKPLESFTVLWLCSGGTLAVLWLLLWLRSGCALAVLFGGALTVLWLGSGCALAVL